MMFTSDLLFFTLLQHDGIKAVMKMETWKRIEEKIPLLKILFMDKD